MIQISCSQRLIFVQTNAVDGGDSNGADNNILDLLHLAMEKVEMARRDLKEVGRRASRLASSMQHEQTRRQAFSDEMDRDREMGERFKAYLNDAYLHAVRDRRQSARAQGASPDALLLLLSAAQLRFERSKIFQLDQT